MSCDLGGYFSFSPLTRGLVPLLYNVNNNNNNNNSELYLHGYFNIALQKRGKQDNYGNLVIRVQFQH